MLIDTRPTATAAPAFNQSKAEPDMSAGIHSTVSVRGLVDAATLLVADLGLDDLALWAMMSSEVAATAVTLRAAVINLTGQKGSRRATGALDAVPVAVSAPPVVRAREIGFLAARLAAILDGIEPDGAHAALTAIGCRLEDDVRMLRDARDIAAPTPRGPRSTRFIRR